MHQAEAWLRQPLTAVQARSTMERPRLPYWAMRRVRNAVQPLVKSNETVPGDIARPQIQHRRASAMHPDVFLASLRSQQRLAVRIPSESEDAKESSEALPLSVLRRLCQRGPVSRARQVQVQKCNQIHAYTNIYICIHIYTFIYSYIHTYT